MILMERLHEKETTGLRLRSGREIFNTGDRRELLAMVGKVRESSQRKDNEEMDTEVLALQDPRPCLISSFEGDFDD